MSLEQFMNRLEWSVLELMAASFSVGLIIGRLLGKRP